MITYRASPAATLQERNDMPEPEILKFTSSGGIPNNPDLPVLLYRAVLLADPGTFEALINKNGWECRWRNGIFDYHHFHSTAHETLAVARGNATVLLGGEDGREVDLSPGDIVILPAGTGHKRIRSSPDLLIVGAYPPGQEYEIEKPKAGGFNEAVTRIKAVPLPTSDPVTGPDGALTRLWTD
jgi:uncharacterized protein YjlB